MLDLATISHKAALAIDTIIVFIGTLMADMEENTTYESLVSPN